VIGFVRGAPTEGETTMTKVQRPCLVAAAALLSVILTPRSSRGEMIYGSFTGVESYTVVYYTDGQVSGGVQASWVPTVLTIEFDTNTLTGSIDVTPVSPSYMGFGWDQDQFTANFNPTNGAATFFGGDHEHSGINGNFSAIYQGIAPDGEIIPLPNGGDAQLEVSAFSQDVFGTGYSYTVEFFTVPEPPSIVHAFGGLLVVSVFWQLRAVSARRSGTSTPRDGN
jgi:hypothetical protein